MNIVFIYVTPIDAMKGGIQKVTCNLAHQFTQNGHKISFLSFKRQVYNDTGFRQLFFPNQKSINNDENISFLNRLVTDYSVDCIINQSGMSPEVHHVLSKSKSVSGFKLVSCIHNSIFGGVDNYGVTHLSQLNRFNLTFLKPLFSLKTVIYILRRLYIVKNRNNYQHLCKESDRVIVLTDAMHREIMMMIGSNSANVTKIPNGTNISDQNPSIGNKKKIFLFVGKLNYGYKRANLLLPIWKKFSQINPDFRLLILGDGEKKMELENEIVEQNIRNVIFEGWQDPVPYYKNALGILMTSCSEGLPMVIIEAMSYGVIPFAYDAFPQIREVIDNNVNGKLAKEGNEDMYVANMLEIASGQKQQELYLKEAYKKSQIYNIQTVVNQWEELLQSVCK